MTPLDHIRRIISMITVYFLGVFYTITSILGSIVDWIKYCLGYWSADLKRPIPLQLLDSSFTHAYLTLPQSNNIRLHYAEAGDTSKPLMLCLHGFPEFWYSWRHQLREFSNDYWVVAVDMRGYGDSDKPVGVSSYTMEKLVDDIRQIPQALGRTKIDVLLAHDWGGAVAWTAVAKYPELTSCFIPMNIPHPDAFRKTLRSSWTQFRKSWYIFFFQIPSVPEWFLKLKDFAWMERAFKSPKNGHSIMSHDELEAFKYNYAKAGALTPPINYYRAVDLFATKTLLPRIKTPTCLIFGTADIALETSMAVDSEQFCEQFELHKLDGVSHWVQQESPAQVNQIVREYLGKRGI